MRFIKAMGQRRLCKKMFLTNLFMAFSIAVFAPLELYITNQASFWFPISLVVKTCLVTFLIAFLILNLLDILSFDKCNIVKYLLWGISLALYLQGNFFPGQYSALDGNPIEWNLYSTGFRVMNILLWAGVITAGFWIGIKKPDVANYISAGLVLVQLITLFTILPTYETKQQILVTNKNEFKLGSKKNIVVLVADSFESPAFARALDENPNLREIFDGFVFYENTVGTSLYSEESLITILTGNQMEVGLSFTENKEKAYQNSPIYRNLKQNEYDVNIYTNTSMAVPALADIADNIVTKLPGVSANLKFAEVLYKTVLFRYSPHEAKRCFFTATQEFDDLMEEGAYTSSNFLFYDRLRSEFEIQDGKSCYQYYYIQGPHAPYRYGRKCTANSPN